MSNANIRLDAVIHANISFDAVSHANIRLAIGSNANISFDTVSNANISLHTLVFSACSWKSRRVILDFVVTFNSAPAGVVSYCVIDWFNWSQKFSPRTSVNTSRPIRPEAHLA